MEDMGPVTYFVRVCLIQNRPNRSIALLQDTYINKIVKKYDIVNCREALTLIESGALNLIVSNPGQATKTEITQYQSKVGSVTYLATQTCTDITFLCSVLSRFLCNPLQVYIKAVDRVIRYLKGTRYLAIVYRGSALKQDVDKGILHRYSDSDFAGDIK